MRHTLQPNSIDLNALSHDVRMQAQSETLTAAASEVGGPGAGSANANATAFAASRADAQGFAPRSVAHTTARRTPRALRGGLMVILAGALVGCTPDTADQLSKDLVRILRNQFFETEDAGLSDPADRPALEDELDSLPDGAEDPSLEDELAASTG